jgi:hypothetical protein
MEPAVTEYLHHHAIAARVAHIVWNHDLLVSMLRKRISAASEERFESLDAISTPALTDVERQIVANLPPLPRVALQVTRQAMLHYAARLDNGGQLDEEDIHHAIAWYRHHAAAQQPPHRVFKDQSILEERGCASQLTPSIEQKGGYDVTLTDPPVYRPDLFVNREKEIETVNKALQNIARGEEMLNRVRTIVFRGERGLGKSWLALHLHRSVLKDEAPCRTRYRIVSLFVRLTPPPEGLTVDKQEWHITDDDASQDRSGR